MNTLWRLLREQASFVRWQLLVIALGCIMVVSTLALLSIATYLVEAASVAALLILLSVPIFLVRFVAVVRPLARYAERCLSHDLTFRILARLRARIYACLEPLAPALLWQYRSGDVLTRLVVDIDELQTLYQRLIAPLAVAGGVILIVGSILWRFNSALVWVACVGLVGAGCGVPALSWWLAHGAGEQCVLVRAEQQATLVDGLQGLPDVLAYGQSRAYLQKIASHDRRLGVLQGRMAKISGMQAALSDLLKQGTMWGVLIVAWPLAERGTLDSIYVGCLALLVLASFEAVQPLGQACQFLGHALAAGHRLCAVLDTIPVVSNPAEPLALSVANQDASYTLAFKHVSFAYHATEPLVLTEIDLCLQPGGRVALVGTSGAGKSTILRLALRYWDPSTGCITLNGEDIRRYTLEDIRALFGVVTQETYLFNTTLRHNLLLARSGASDEELMRVLEQAQLGAFVRALPAGLDTWLGEQGLRLSGGERQRLALARALLKDAPVLLLDEVTANLDLQTEQRVLATIHGLPRTYTILFVTHRLLAMEQMDEIIVLEGGIIQERGTHAQLLIKQGRYAQLYAIQQSTLVFSENVCTEQ